MTLVRLLDDGVIPHVRVGTHRRVALASVVSWREDQAFEGLLASGRRRTRGAMRRLRAKV